MDPMKFRSILLVLAIVGGIASFASVLVLTTSGADTREAYLAFLGCAILPLMSFGGEY